MADTFNNICITRLEFKRVYLRILPLLFSLAVLTQGGLSLIYAQANTISPDNTSHGMRETLSNTPPAIILDYAQGVPSKIATTQSEYWIDTVNNSSGGMTLHELLLRGGTIPFQRQDEIVPNLGYVNGAVWLRFKIRYRNIVQTRQEPLVLALGNRFADTVELYITRHDSVHYADTVGFSVAYHSWQPPAMQIAFLMPPTAALDSTEYVCYIRMRTNGVLPYFVIFRPLSIFTAKEYQALQPLLLFYGIAIFALLYNILLWFATRSNFFSLYIGYVFCIVLSVALDYGHFYQLFGVDIPHLNGRLYVFSSLLSMVFGVLFVVILIREQQSFTIHRLWYRLIYLFGAVCGIGFIAEFAGARAWTLNILYYGYLFLAIPTTLGLSFIAWRKGYRPALYLFLARVFAEVGIIFNVLSALDWIPLLSNWVGQLTLLTPAVEMIFMGLALAARINTLQRAKQVAERKAWESEIYRKKNEELSAANEEIRHQQHEMMVQAQNIQEMNTQVSMLNLSLQNQNQKLAEINHEKDELLGIVAHDLKNPIGAVRGLADVVSQGFVQEPNEVKSLLGQIVVTADRMLDLVQNLLDVHQLEEGARQFTIVPMDIAPMAESVVWQYQQPAKAKNLTLHYSTESPSTIALADEQAILTVLENLVSNAVKYSPLDKNIIVRLRATYSVVRIEVHDEGPGISEEDMKKLFGKFARLSAQPTGGEHSTGLGLSIVKKMVEAMNGRVWCESELGKGATFMVELPKAV